MGLCGSRRQSGKGSAPVSVELTPQEFAKVIELVGPEIAEVDRVAVTESVQGFRTSMRELCADFVSERGPERGRAHG
jgi:hypothetical protein